MEKSALLNQTMALKIQSDVDQTEMYDQLFKPIEPELDSQIQLNLQKTKLNKNTDKYNQISFYNIAVFLQITAKDKILHDFKFKSEYSVSRICEQLESYNIISRKNTFNKRLDFTNNKQYLFFLNQRIYLFFSANDIGYQVFEAEKGFTQISYKNSQILMPLTIIQIQASLTQSVVLKIGSKALEKPDDYGAQFFLRILNQSFSSVQNFLVAKFFLVIAVMTIPPFLYTLMNQSMAQKNLGHTTYYSIGLLLFLLFQVTAIVISLKSQNSILIHFKKNVISDFYRTFLNFNSQLLRPGYITTRLGLVEFAFHAYKFKKLELPIYTGLMVMYLIYVGQYSVVASVLLGTAFVVASFIIYQLRKKGSFTELNTVKIKQDLYDYYLDVSRNMNTHRIQKNYFETIQKLNFQIRSMLIGGAEYINGLSTIQFIGLAIFKCASVFTLYFFLNELIQNRATTTQLFGISMVLSYLFMPFQALSQYFINFNTTGLLSLPVQFLKPEIVQLEKPTTSFTFESYFLLEKLSFRYQPQNTFILSDISLKVNKGDVIALMGRSESGKTTLAQVIAGFHENYYGKILIDDKDLKHLDSHAFFTQFSYLPQEPELTEGTFISNLVPQNLSCDVNEIYDLVDKIGLDDVIRSKLKGDYYFKITNYNQTFSSREKILIALVKIFLEKSKVIVFDDFLAALDICESKRIMDILLEIKSDRTYIFVTSDVRLAQKANKILVLKSGRLIEEGSHKKLVLLNGDYADMFRYQIGDQ